MDARASSVFKKMDRERVIHEAGCSGRCHRPKARTTIRIEPRDHLIELATEATCRNCDPNPDGQNPFGIAMNN